MPTDLISQAAAVLQAGDRARARQLLAMALQQNPQDENAWLWLSGAVETDGERLDCLRHVLAINPDNKMAIAGLKSLSDPSKFQLVNQPHLDVSAKFEDPVDESLEAFIQEEVERLFPTLPVTQEEERAPISDAEFEEPEPSAPPEEPERWDDPYLEDSSQNYEVEPAFSLPAAPAPPTARIGMRFLRVKKPRLSSYPKQRLPITFNHVILFILGAAITFLMLLIGFSLMKTRIHGPRYFAGLPATPTVTPSPTPVPEPTPVVFIPVSVSADCRFTLPQGVSVKCLNVIVPESRDGTSVRTQRLAVAIYKSPNPSPAPDPALYLHGGPGASAIEWAAANFESFVVPLLQDRDIIVFDQRGTGQSTPTLDCPEMDFLYHAELGTNLTDGERAEARITALQNCRDRLTAQGIRLSRYTTSASAADVKDIVTISGYEQVNLYGISYGSGVAQLVMRDFPAIVRSAVLDSALPLEVVRYDTIAAGADDALERLFESCAENSACRSAYPDLETVFVDLTEKLEASPITVDSTGPGSATHPNLVVDGARFQFTLIRALHSPEMIRDIPQAIYALRAGDTTFLEIALSLPRIWYHDISLGAVLSADCHEQVYPLSQGGLANNQYAYSGTAALGLSWIYGSGEALFRICDLWDAAPFDPKIKEPLVAAIPVLIFSGEYDPTTPPFLSQQLTSHLDRAYFFEFPGLGHAPSGGPGGECPLYLATTFLRDPYTAPGPNCAAGMAIQFNVR